jgi:hypothetical protein
MSTVRRVLAGLVVIGVTALISGTATFAAFSASAGNANDSYSAGTVRLVDDDSGTAMWNVTGLLPGATVVRCIRVTYAGSLAADVRTYANSSADPLDPYLDLSIEKGTMPGATSFPNCGGFSAAATVYTGTLQDFRNTKTGFATGVATYPGSQTRWNDGDEVVYRFTVTVAASTASQGLTSTTGFTWEARNQ